MELSSKQAAALKIAGGVVVLLIGLGLLVLFFAWTFGESQGWKTLLGIAALIFAIAILWQALNGMVHGGFDLFRPALLILSLFLCFTAGTYLWMHLMQPESMQDHIAGQTNADWFQALSPQGKVAYYAIVANPIGNIVVLLIALLLGLVAEVAGHAKKTVASLEELSTSITTIKSDVDSVRRSTANAANDLQDLKREAQNQPTT